MKCLILLSAMVLLFNTSYCQKLKSAINNNIKAKAQIYSIRSMPNNKQIFISNSSNRLVNQKANYVPTDFSANLKNIHAINKSFKEVFAGQRAKELASEKFLYLSFYVNHLGEPMEIQFLAPENTSVTPNEIEDLEKALKRNVVFKVSGTNLERGNFYEVSFLAKYNNVFK